MFVDVAKVSIRAGKGGNGAISFRREIYIPKGGPDGGDGGKGGDVVFVATKDLDTLLDFRFQPRLIAEDGKAGSGQKSYGRSGKDLIVKVPVGTVVKRAGEVVADLTFDGDRQIVAHGGDGGYGNWHFRSSTRQTPRIAELGNPGEAFEAELELKLLADVGLVGFPNAGKSTFLSVVSNATPEIANYPFTTITPNLGVARVDDSSILIADIPGLIEGASEGKGLGDQFLRHVERTKVLLHLVDIYSDDAGKAYSDIRNELQKYSQELAARPELVVLTKAEGVDEDIISMQTDAIKAINPEAEVMVMSALAHQGTTEVLRALRDKVHAAKQAEAEVADRRRGDMAVVVEGKLLTKEEHGDESLSELPVISLKPGAKKRRVHHQKYQLGERNAVIALNPSAKTGDDFNEAEANRLAEAERQRLAAELSEDEYDEYDDDLED